MKQNFYREELTKCSAPDYKHNFFEVESVLKTKKVGNKKEYFVKFLYYPNKFNRWIKEEDLKGE